MWYKFEDDNPIGIPRIKGYQVAWYDMEQEQNCFDESFYKPEDIDKVITYVETVEDVNNCDRSRVFVHFDDGDIYELKLEKIEGRRCGKFYD